MNFFIFLATFIAAYILGGRKIGIPYGIAMTSSPWLVIFLSLLLELIQIPFFYSLYGKSRDIKWLERFHHHAKKGRKKLKESKSWKWARRFGTAGIFLISSLPSFGGGIWSSVLLAFMLKTDKKVSYFMILSGSFICIFSLAYFSHIILSFIRMVI